MKTLKLWWSECRRKRNRNLWESGFSWAAGQLLLEQETPRSIMMKVDGSLTIMGKMDAFDEGCVAAVKALRNVDIVVKS